MANFTDLSFEKKQQLMINLRTLSIMAQVVAESIGAELPEVMEMFYKKASVDILNLPEAEIDKHLSKIDRTVDEFINKEVSGFVKISLE